MIKPVANIEKISPYKPGRTIEEIKKEYSLAEVIKLASNENSFGTSPMAVEAIKKYASTAFRYADGSCYNLKKRLAEKLDVSHETIIIGNGSNEIIELIFRTFIKENDNIISCAPTFSFYKICSKTTYGNFIEVPLLDYKFNLNGILEKVNDNTKVVIICNPNNPTGTILGEGEMAEFLDKMPENVLVAIDEAYIEFDYNFKKINSIKLLKKFKDKNIIILRTFSKVYGLSALRIGYGISNKDIINFLDKVRQPFNVNGFAQIAAEAALGDIDFYNKTINGVIKGKDFLYNELEKLNIKYLKSAANFIFFELPFDNDLIFEKFLKKGIIIRSLKSFGYNNALRVTVGTEEENIKFIETLKKVLKELE